MVALQNLVLLLAGSIAGVSAGGCSLPPCGSVYNNTPYKMKWADLGKNNGDCNVYNCWGDGCSDFSENRRNRIKTCKQAFVNPGVHKGGYNNDGIDVDAICFHDRVWEMRWKDGRTIPLQKGEWAKIKSSQSVTCSKIGAAPGIACYEV